MEVMFDRACGLDVHRDTIVACFLAGANEARPKKEVRTFRTHTRGLFELRDWLLEQKVAAIAMESTGVYWKAIYGVLETETWSLVVANAEHVKKVPGRKTDVKDAEWLARLLRSGLLRASFVPPPPIRDLRELSRYRTKLVQERVRERTRTIKVLEAANVKLAGTISDVFGVSGVAMLHALAAGTSTPRAIAELAKGRMRKKIDALEVALDSRLTEVHREMLRIALRRLERADEDIRDVEALIEMRLSPYAVEREKLDQIPGVDRTVATAILAELGPDMSAFPSAGHVASWAGVCPGKDESAGRQRSGRPASGNHHLKTLLCEAAHAASKQRGSYLKDKFHRLKARRGHKRAIIAIAHKILVAAYHVLSGKRDYRDLGPNYLDELDRTRTAKRLTSRLQALGFSVALSPAGPAAPG